MEQAFLEDPAAVAAMAAGDPAGLESLYRRYADRIHAYARSIVDDDTAADVLQETFLLAQQRVGQLRDPARVGAWLYAIARNECLAKLRARKRTVVLAESYEPVLDTDPGRAVHAEQVRELVQAAAGGLNDGDREVLELTVRHGLPAADVARVLGVSEKHAHARISRARAQFAGALGALMLARDTPGRCEQLDAILSGWDGQLSALLRKRVDRHARGCPVCSQRRQERMNPAALLAGYAALPFAAVAAELWPRLTAAPDAAAAGVVSAGGGSPASGPPVDGPPASGPPAGGSPSAGGGPPVGAGPPVGGSSVGGSSVGGSAVGGSAVGGSAVGGSPGGQAPFAGSPGGPNATLILPGPNRPAGPARRSNVRLVLGAAAAVVAIILGVSAVRLLTLDRGLAPAAAQSPQPTALTATAEPLAPMSISEPPTTAPPSTPSPTPTTTTTTSSTPPPAFTVTAQGKLCDTSPYPLIVTATATLPLAQARIFYEFPINAPVREAAMTVAGSTAEVTVQDWAFAPEVRWWVHAQSTDARTFDTPPQTTFFGPC